MADFTIVFIGLSLVILSWLIVLLFKRNANLEFHIMKMELDFAEFEIHRLEHMINMKIQPCSTKLLHDKFVRKVDAFIEKMTQTIKTK